MRKATNLFVVMFFMILPLLQSCASSSVKVHAVVPDFDLSGKSYRTDTPVKVAIEEFKSAIGVNSKGNVIGEAKTGAFNTKTDIISEEPVTLIVTEAVRNGFQRSGFVLIEKESANYVVQGTIERFWVDEYATGFSFEYSKAHVRYDLLLFNAIGETVWGRSLEKYEVSGKSMDTTKNNMPTLTKALKHSVELIFQDESFWKAISLQDGPPTNKPAR